MSVPYSVCVNKIPHIRYLMNNPHLIWVINFESVWLLVIGDWWLNVKIYIGYKSNEESSVHH